MRSILFLLISIMMAAGCAKIQVQAPKEPIKVDISMRLDIYQHVEQDIDEIENIVSGEIEEPQSRVIDKILNFFVTDAYALEGLGPEVTEAALRRRDRHDELVAWLIKGIIGENNTGFVEVRKMDEVDDSVKALVQAENNDRLVIFEGVAKKNETSVDEVRKIYAKKSAGRCPCRNAGPGYR